ncbi:hypothetical protein ACHWQZ_G014066 [Mnemiopsis leidyi]
MVIRLILLAFLRFTTGLEADKVGIVHMHGFWQAFDAQHHLDFKNFVEEKTGVKVHLIDAFNDIEKPPAESSMTPLWAQVPVILEKVKNISAHYDKIIAVGFSQGGVIWRAMIESWDNHNVDTFISLASPQGGQAEIPANYLALMGGGQPQLSPFFPIPKSKFSASCLGLPPPPLIENLLSVKETMKEANVELSPYNPGVQQKFAPSNYYRNPDTNTFYLQTEFFPKLNNEVGGKKAKQRQKINFERLRKLVLIGGPDDGTVIPWQSEIFGFRTADKKIVPMEETQFYKDDLFGLKTLNKKGAITTCIKGGLRHNDFPNSSDVLNDCVLPAIQDILKFES